MGDAVRAFRVARQGLAGDGSPSAQDVLAVWAVQDSPPGAAATALAARGVAVDGRWLDRACFEMRDAVALYNARTATAVVPASEVAAFATALHPGTDERALQEILGGALRESDRSPVEAAALGVAAIADALDGVALSRDDLHEQLRRRLPADLLPWCPGCESHHARRGLLVLAGLEGRLCLAGRAGRQPAFARTDQLVGFRAPARRTAQAELVRRYLSRYGPSTPKELAAWAGIAPAHAATLWDQVPADELSPVGQAWVLRADVRTVKRPPAAHGVRLLGPGDPLLLGRDRQALVPDEAVRKRLWSPIPTTGLVLVDGEPAATWKARKQGRRLTLTLDAFAAVPGPPLAEQAERLAAARGCTAAQISRR